MCKVSFNCPDTEWGRSGASALPKEATMEELIRMIINKTDSMTYDEMVSYIEGVKSCVILPGLDEALVLHLYRSASEHIRQYARLLADIGSCV